MKYLLIIFTSLLASCSGDACCIVSEEAAKDALYSGQTEVCYGDHDVSNRLDKDEWAIHMESLGCHCTY